MRSLLVPALLAGSLLAACGPSIADVDDPDLDTELDSDTEAPDWSPTWPVPEWETAPPQEVGIDPEAVEDALDYAFTPGFSTQGALIVKDGYIVGERYADGVDAETAATSWSVGKSMLSVAVGIAIDDGDVKSVDDPVSAAVEAAG